LIGFLWKDVLLLLGLCFLSDGIYGCYVNRKVLRDWIDSELFSKGILILKRHTSHNRASEDNAESFCYI